MFPKAHKSIIKQTPKHDSLVFINTENAPTRSDLNISKEEYATLIVKDYAQEVKVNK